MKELLKKLAAGMEGYEEKKSNPQVPTNGVKSINVQNTSNDDEYNKAKVEDKQKEEDDQKVEDTKKDTTEKTVENVNNMPDLPVVIDFFEQNPNPVDDAVHQYAEENGYDNHQFENVIYRLATIAAELLRGGRSSEMELDVATVDPQQLEMGVEIEYEHTTNPAIAKKIALDHLAELPDYYTRLQQMEEMAKKSNEAAATPAQPSVEKEHVPSEKLEEPNGNYKTIPEPSMFIPTEQQGGHSYY